MLFGTQEADFPALLYLNLPFKGAGIVSPAEEGVIPHCIREFQRTFIKDFIGGIFNIPIQEIHQCTIFSISSHVLSRLLGVTAFHVQNSKDYIGKSCNHHWLQTRAGKILALALGIYTCFLSRIWGQSFCQVLDRLFTLLPCDSPTLKNIYRWLLKKFREEHIFPWWKFFLFSHSESESKGPSYICKF